MAHEMGNNYIAIDIGGTKTLLAAMNANGEILESFKFPTPETYDDFLPELEKAVDKLTTKDFRAGCVAVPGTIDRKKGKLIQLGNRTGWQNLPVLRDVERIVQCPLVIENDAKLAGLSEAMLLKKQYKRVLYITISTGIGIGLTVDGRIDEEIGDGGGHSILLPHHDKLVPWESFASGSAIVRTYGKMASEITDKATWAKIVRNFTPGFIELIAILEPEAIVVGGGAGHYIDRFHDLLMKDLRKYETPMLHIPPILGAKRPDEAVVYGCYDYTIQHFVS